MIRRRDAGIAVAYTAVLAYVFGPDVAVYVAAGMLYTYLKVRGNEDVVTERLEQGAAIQISMLAALVAYVYVWPLVIVYHRVRRYRA